MTAVAIVTLTVLSYIIGWAIGQPLLLPILNTSASYPFMLAALRRGNLRLAIARMLVWALTMGVCATLASYWNPSRAGDVFLRGASYRTEMFAWVMTGRGAESTPSQFIPRQVRDAALFAALALASGGALAMPLGAVLMNQMGHYVGAFAAASARPALAMVLAWHPWAVIRIVSFVTIGVVLSQPLLSRIVGTQMTDKESGRLLGWAGAGLVIDVILKTLFAPLWQQLLLRVARW